MTIARLYKMDATPEPLFREAWIEADEEGTAQLVVNRGSLGHESTTESADVVALEEAERLFAAFREQCEADGFRELAPEECETLIVQYKLKTREGTERDSYFERKTREALTRYFAWRGLGEIVETERGAFRLNHVVRVPDAKRAVKGALIALREFDPTKMTLAVAPRGSDRFARRHPDKGPAFSRFGD